MWLDRYQWISGSPQRRHIATTTDGSEEVIVRGGEDMNAIYRESWPEVIPARPRDELAKILDAPSESAEVAPHRSEQGGVGDHRGGVHVRDQRDRECKRSSRQVSASVSAPPRLKPITPTGRSSSASSQLSRGRASRRFWRSASKLRTKSAVQ